VVAIHHKIDGIPARFLKGELANGNDKIDRHRVAHRRRTHHDFAVDRGNNLPAIFINNEYLERVAPGLGTGKTHARGNGAGGVHCGKFRGPERIKSADDDQLAAEILRMVAQGEDFNVHSNGLY